MRILIWTDPHTNVKAFNDMRPDGVPMRAPEMASTFMWLGEVVEKKNVDRVYMLGDLFDKVANLRFPYFNLAFAGVRAAHNVPIHMLDGNHDKYDPIYKVLEPFRVFAQVYSEPTAYYDAGIGYRMVFIPFQRDMELFKAVVEKSLAEEEKTLVFLHQGPSGHVIDPMSYDKRLFDRPWVEKVFGGHYHFKFTEGLGNDPERLVYPGSVISLHFDDQFSSKYAVIYDTKTKSLEWLENPHSAFFLALDQNQIVETMDQLETLAPVSYIKVILKEEDESLTVPMSFLLKFRGHKVVNAKTEEEEEVTTYRMGDDASTGFDYDGFAKILASQTEHFSYDLSFSDYSGLITESIEAKAEMKNTNQKVLEGVMSEAYLLGVN